MENFFTRIRKAEVVVVSSKEIGCTGYADDVVLVAERREDMDRAPSDCR